MSSALNLSHCVREMTSVNWFSEPLTCELFMMKLNCNDHQTICLTRDITLSDFPLFAFTKCVTAMLSDSKRMRLPINLSFQRHTAKATGTCSRNESLSKYPKHSIFLANGEKPNHLESKHPMLNKNHRHYQSVTAAEKMSNHCQACMKSH